MPILDKHHFQTNHIYKTSAVFSTCANYTNAHSKKKLGEFNIYEREFGSAQAGYSIMWDWIQKMWDWIQKMWNWIKKYLVLVLYGIILAFVIVSCVHLNDDYDNIENSKNWISLPALISLSVHLVVKMVQLVLVQTHMEIQLPDWLFVSEDLRATVLDFGVTLYGIISAILVLRLEPNNALRFFAISAIVSAFLVIIHCFYRHGHKLWTLICCKLWTLICCKHGETDNTEEKKELAAPSNTPKEVKYSKVNTGTPLIIV